MMCAEYIFSFHAATTANTSITCDPQRSKKKKKQKQLPMANGCNILVKKSGWRRNNSIIIHSIAMLYSSRNLEYVQIRLHIYQLFCKYQSLKILFGSVVCFVFGCFFKLYLSLKRLLNWIFSFFWYIFKNFLHTIRNINKIWNKPPEQIFLFFFIAQLPL